MLRKIGRNYQIAVPKEIVNILRLQVNEYVDIHVQGSKIILEPQVLIPKDQAYFYSPEWQKEERQAEKDVREGRVTKTKDLKDLFKTLDG